MRDPASEDAGLAEFLVDMQRVVVANQASEQRHVAFTDGAAARALRRIQYEVLEIKPQRALPVFRPAFGRQTATFCIN
jgi:hypothetical protein